MIVATPNDKNDFILTTWKFRSEPAVEYPITWSSCSNPFCRCTKMDLYIGIDGENDPVAAFEVDIAKKEIVKKAARSDDGFADRVLSDISESDWEAMHKVFISGKILCTEECDPEQIDPPDFPIKEIENESLMIGYQEIFPWAEILTFKIDGILYALQDMYCLCSLCACKDAVIDFPGFREGMATPETPVAAVLFNYDNGKWEELDKGSSGHDCKTLVREMLGKYPDAVRIFNARKARLRTLYHRFRKTQLPSPMSEQTPKKASAGRNDPCPCGSGKKFKKCCGK